jgi:hypothetical protein
MKEHTDDQVAVDAAIEPRKPLRQVTGMERAGNCQRLKTAL